MAGKKLVQYDVAIQGANDIVGQILERDIISKDEAINSADDCASRYADTKIVVVEKTTQIVHVGQKREKK